MTIHMHNNDTQNAWGRGDYKVMIKTLNSDKPMGYCDGTDEDRQELLDMAEGEGVQNLNIQVKVMYRTMREVWTVAGEGTDEDGGGDEDMDYSS